MLKEARLVVDAKATLGEGPCWDDIHNRLYWVDILEKKLYAFEPDGHHQECISFEQYIGAVALTESGEMVLAMQNGFHTYHRREGTLRLIHDPESHLPHNRFNDGKCDPAGRFWAGTMDLYGVDKKGALYYLDTDLSVKKVLSEISVSNGMAWSPDQRRMYYIDTPTRQIVAFDYYSDSGEIRNRRVAVTIPEGEGVPDGMTIDQEGMLWVAHFGGYQVSRWDPARGERLEVIHVPASNVTSCVFGGKK